MWRVVLLIKPGSQAFFFVRESRTDTPVRGPKRHTESLRTGLTAPYWKTAVRELHKKVLTVFTTAEVETRFPNILLEGGALSVVENPIRTCSPYPSLANKQPRAHSATSASSILSYCIDAALSVKFFAKNLTIYSG